LSTEKKIIPPLWRRLGGWLLPLAIVLGIAGWYLQSPQYNSNVARILKVAEEGKSLAHFKVTPFNGPAQTIGSLRGKPVLLDFWASWCPPCRVSMPELAFFANNNQDRIHVLAINLFESESDGIEFANDSGYSLNFARADALASHLGVQVLPTKVLLDAEGKLIWAGTGHLPLITHWLLSAQL
jgi:thiol-disulfide isomerase/thioredoxin